MTAEVRDRARDQAERPVLMISFPSPHEAEGRGSFPQGPIAKPGSHTGTTNLPGIYITDKQVLAHTYSSEVIKVSTRP